MADPWVLTSSSNSLSPLSPPKHLISRESPPREGRRHIQISCGCCLDTPVSCFWLLCGGAHPDIRGLLCIVHPGLWRFYYLQRSSKKRKPCCLPNTRSPFNIWSIVLKGKLLPNIQSLFKTLVECLTVGRALLLVVDAVVTWDEGWLKLAQNWNRTFNMMYALKWLTEERKNIKFVCIFSSHL